MATVSRIIGIEEYYAPDLITKESYHYSRGPHAYWPDSEGWKDGTWSWGRFPLPDAMVASEFDYQEARAKRVLTNWPE